MPATARRPREHWREWGTGPCCERAQTITPGHPKYPLRDYRCVCAYVEYCPDHGVTHVGTHD